MRGKKSALSCDGAKGVGGYQDNRLRVESQCARQKQRSRCRSVHGGAAGSGGDWGGVGVGVGEDVYSRRIVVCGD